MKRNVKNILKKQLFSIHKLGTRLGVHVMPVHYYSPMPDVIELEKTQDIWAKKSEMPGIHFDLDEQVKNLRETCLPYQAEYAGNKPFKYAVEKAFGPGYGYVEAQALHGVLRHYKPQRVVEVGSGVSTWCMLHALDMNQAETNQPYSLTCIEPYPSQKLQELQGDKIQLISKPVQTVPFEEGFAQLQANDLLFIDSSHTVKPGSDVNYLFLEILPRIKPGVIIHIHDIYLPYDYSRTVLQTFFYWMGTSLLPAFLINNDKVKILFCQSHLHYDRQADLKEVFPEYNPQKDINGIRDAKYKAFDNPTTEHFPASIFLQILE